MMENKKEKLYIEIENINININIYETDILHGRVKVMGGVNVRGGNLLVIGTPSKVAKEASKDYQSLLFLECFQAFLTGSQGIITLSLSLHPWFPICPRNSHFASIFPLNNLQLLLTLFIPLNQYSKNFSDLCRFFLYGLSHTPHRT